MHMPDDENNTAPELVQPLTVKNMDNFTEGNSSGRFKDLPVLRGKNGKAKEVRSLRSYMERYALEERIYKYYKEVANLEKTIEYVKTLSIPDKYLPKSTRGYTQMLFYLDQKYNGQAPGLVQQSGFKDLLHSIDDILELPSGPIGAVYQNLIKISLEHIVELEKGYANETCSDLERIKKYRDVQEAILKYVSQIKGLLDKVKECYTSEEEVKAKVKRYAAVESERILCMVRDAIFEVCPGKSKQFKSALIMKLGRAYGDPTEQ